MITPQGPVCSRCGEWMLPYHDGPHAALACTICDHLKVTVVPEYAMGEPPVVDPPEDEQEVFSKRPPFEDGGAG